MARLAGPADLGQLRELRYAAAKTVSPKRSSKGSDAGIVPWQANMPHVCSQIASRLAMKNENNEENYISGRFG